MKKAKAQLIAAIHQAFQVKVYSLLNSTDGAYILVSTQGLIAAIANLPDDSEFDFRVEDRVLYLN